MPIVERYGFERDTVKVIKEAFVFLKQKIQQFGENKKRMEEKRQRIHELSQL